jgi:hypothetical protein
MDSENRNKVFILDGIAEANHKKHLRQGSYNPIKDTHLHLFFMKPSIKKILESVNGRLSRFIELRLA